MPYLKKSLDDIYGSMASDARGRIPELSDFEEGSVVRSLLESFSAELSLLYEQLDLVYQAGFVDTAGGADLDHVVAILGLKRNEPDYATGAVTFTRDAGSNTGLTIPIGTLVTTEDMPDQNPSRKSYSTTQTGQMAPGKDSVDVPVQATMQGRQMTADGGAVIVMPRPVPGAKSVTNANPIRFLGRDRENDDQLRQRAKQALLASGRASKTSIENALLGMPGVRDVHVTEDEKKPGVITVYVDGLTADNSADIVARINDVRAAGIYATAKPAVAVNLDAVVKIDINPKISADERTELEEKARSAVINLVDSLGMGQPLLISRLMAALLKVNGVNDVAQFEMSTFLEGDNCAEGQVTLHRGATGSALSIPATTTVQTAAGQQFTLTADAKFGDKQADVTVPVKATEPGRAGELLRTGSASNWAVLKTSGTDITVANAGPIRLARTDYKLTDRSIPVDVLQRLTPNSVRVAGEIKPLPVRVQIRLEDAAGRDALRKPLETAVQAFFQDLSSKQEHDPSFTKADLTAKLNTVTPTPGAFDLRLVAFAFQSHTPQDEFRVDVSFVERPQPEIVFVYTDSLQLTGSINLVLSLTAQAAQKNAVAGSVRQAIEDYLDGIGPEQDISLEQFQQIAAAVDKVLRVEFRPENCVLLDAQGKPLTDRIQGTRVSVKPFEKVFLSAGKFVIQA